MINNGKTKIEDSVANELNMQTRNILGISDEGYRSGVEFEALNAVDENKASSLSAAHMKQLERI